MKVRITRSFLQIKGSFLFQLLKINLLLAHILRRLHALVVIAGQIVAEQADLEFIRVAVGPLLILGQEQVKSIRRAHSCTAHMHDYDSAAAYITIALMDNMIQDALE